MIQKVGFLLVGAGALVLLVWSVQGFFMASEISLVVRISVGVIGIGLLTLIGTVIRDRIAAAKTEDFKEVRQ